MGKSKMTNTQIKLTEEETQNINFLISAINKADEAIRNIDPSFEDFSEEDYRGYLEGVCDIAINYRTALHEMRKTLCEKYKLPYDFISRNGEIFLP